MTYLEQLDGAFATQFASRAVTQNWAGPAKEEYAVGAAHIYTAGDIRIRLTVERGLMDVEIGPTSIDGGMFSVSRYRDWVDPPSKGHWNLSLAESARFIEVHWDRLMRDLRPENARETVRRLSMLDDP